MIVGVLNSTTNFAVYRFKVDDLTTSYRLHLKCLNVIGNPISLKSYIISNHGNMSEITNLSIVWSEIRLANIDSTNVLEAGKEFEANVDKAYFDNLNDDYITVVFRVTNEEEGNYYLLSDYSSFKPYLTIKDW